MKTNKMTTLLLPAVLSVCTGLNAATPGTYVGIGGGYSAVQSFDEMTQTDDANFGGRVFAGYNFNHYFGVEANYLSLGKANYIFNANPTVGFDYKLNALSLVGKGYLPIRSEDGPVNLYGLIGAAQSYGNFNITQYSTSILNDSASGLVLTAGVGATYDISEKITAGLEISSFGSKESDYSHNGIPGSALATLSLAYKF